MFRRKKYNFYFTFSYKIKDSIIDSGAVIDINIKEISEEALNYIRKELKDDLEKKNKQKVDCIIIKNWKKLK